MRVPSLASVWNAELTQAQPTLVRYSTGLQLASSHFTATFAPIHAMVEYCRPDGLDDAHKQLCDSLANKFLDQDDSVIGLSMATFIGKKIGWDAARIQALRDEKGVVLAMMGDMMPDEKMYSCASLSKQIQETQSWLSKTDRAISRDRIASSGKSFPELVEEYRERSPSSLK